MDLNRMSLIIPGKLSLFSRSPLPIDCGWPTWIDEHPAEQINRLCRIIQRSES